MHRSLPGVAFDEAIELVTAALKEQGFGVLTSIDVAATFKAKLGVDFRPYVILGACNPVLANQALSADDNIGLMLPCNVVVAAAEGGSEVSCVRPHAMMDIADAPEIRDVADQAQASLERVLEVIADQSTAAEV
ncbi:MAG: DUF302 domain-containing protein [Gemmatimonadetes bacterium]|nr:DUF302 domain-containing protein [Gemmatimonadota bacterium]MBT8478226.1 DUF302 domain-containing protein [Gemmatimonadota bacterium]NNK47458.1 DUF302 domain-containing protein [Gemmatimonadota bacterium]